MLENSTKSDDDLCKIAVAPYAGAWIETCTPLWLSWITWSLPTRERGTETFRVQGNAGVGALPSIGCGLKYNNQNIKTIGDAINSFIKVQTEIYQIS